MGRFLFLALAMLAVGSATAQQEVELREVTVKGARTVQRVDGQWIYPTPQQLESSPNGYSLLSKLALPHIRVDEATHAVTALTGLGAVQVRINDIVASREDLLSLDMKGVERIEFTDNPGVRYGEGLAYLINIIVRKPVSGFVVGADLTNTLTTVNGNETVFGKVNHGRSEFAVSYGLDYQRFKGGGYDELATYQLDDRTVSVHRQRLSGQTRSLSRDAQLTYSLSDSSYVFQAKLSGNRDIRPQRNDAEMSVDGAVYGDHSASRTSSPSLDLYYHQDFRRHQSLTANLVGTYIRSEGDTESNEGGAYRYVTDGKTHSLWGEAVYENRLRPFTLSSGIQYTQRYSRNAYTGDAEALNETRTSGVYLFSQLQGRVGRLGWMGGLGVSHRYYRQARYDNRFWLFRPKLTVSCPLAERLKLKYGFEVSQHTSQIALISDVSVKQNAYETLVGNPDLKPNRVTSHDLHLTYTTPRLTADLQGYYRLNAHCNMEQYVREDGHFYKTQANAGNHCDFFFIQSYNRCEIVPDRLSATVYGGFWRYLNFGPDYTHTYSTWNGGASMEAYLGRWMLTAYADSGWDFMEGEHRGRQGAAWYLTASYRLRRLTVSLYAQHLFAQHPLTQRSEVVSRYIHKVMTMRSRDLGNMLTLNLSWELSSGRRYRDIRRTMNHQDTETGILK